MRNLALLAVTIWSTGVVCANGLNDTGVTRCHDAANSQVPCNAAPAADDGRYGRDAAAGAGALSKIGGGPAGFDFTKIGNNGRELPANALLGTAPADWACTRDNLTGLVWEIKTNGGTRDLRSALHRYTWFNPNAAENGGNPGSPGSAATCSNTLPQCNTLAFVATVNMTALCGFTDWRLPTPRELRSIVHYGVGEAGSFDGAYFPAAVIPNPHYFTSSTYAADPANVWLTEIGGEADGGGAGHNHGKSEDQLIMLVRGPQSVAISNCDAPNARAGIAPSTPTVDFFDHGDGTVTHIPTGLMWKRCAEGLSGSTCAAGEARSVTWSDAISTAESSTFAGYSDWRLPNLKELHSIVETCGHDLAINQRIFPNTPFQAGGAVFWSGTTSAVRPAEVWIAVFNRGGVLTNGKSSRMYLRLVRGGESGGSFDVQNPPPPRRRRPARK